jgi:hypothetical protein
MNHMALDSFESLLQLYPVLMLYLALGVLTLAVSGGAHLWHHRHDRRDPESLASLMED